MPNHPNPEPTSAQTEPEADHGTFAEGESNAEAYPEENHVGTFAEARETQP